MCADTRSQGKDASPSGLEVDPRHRTPLTPLRKLWVPPFPSELSVDTPVPSPSSTFSPPSSPLFVLYPWVSWFAGKERARVLRASGGTGRRGEWDLSLGHGRHVPMDRGRVGRGWGDGRSPLSSSLSATPRVVPVFQFPSVPPQSTEGLLHNPPAAPLFLCPFGSLPRTTLLVAKLSPPFLVARPSRQAPRPPPGTRRARVDQ